MARKTHDMNTTRLINSHRTLYEFDKTTGEFNSFVDNDYRKIKTLAQTYERYNYTYGEKKQLRRGNNQYRSKRKSNVRGKAVK